MSKDGETSQEVPDAKEGLTLAQRKFLAAYSTTGIVGRAAKAAGVSRRNHSRWMDQEAYRQAFADAEAEAADAIEAEVRDRALIGECEEVWYQGEVVGHRYRKSDVLLIFAAKGAMPEKYADRNVSRVDVNGRAEVELIQLPDNGRDPKSSDS